MRYLDLDRGTEGFIVNRVIHVGKHEILPNQDAELIAQSVECLLLVHHGADNPDHVHAGLLRQAQAVHQVSGRPAERNDVVYGPAGSAAKHRRVVNEKLEVTIVVLHFGAFETDSPNIHRHDATVDRNLKLAGMHHRMAVSVRPP